MNLKIDFTFTNIALLPNVHGAANVIENENSEQVAVFSPQKCVAVWLKEK